MPRHAAQVMLIADSEQGRIRYEAAVAFFPHNDEEDYAVSYDAYFSRVIYDAAGRRSKKREQGLMQTLRETADALAEDCGGRIFWDAPLRAAQYG